MYATCLLSRSIKPRFTVAIINRDDTLSNKFQSYLPIVSANCAPSISMHHRKNNVIDTGKYIRHKIALVSSPVVVERASRRNFKQSKIHFRHGRIAALTMLESKPERASRNMNRDRGKTSREANGRERKREKRATLRNRACFKFLPFTRHRSRSIRSRESAPLIDLSSRPRSLIYSRCFQLAILRYYASENNNSGSLYSNTNDCDYDIYFAISFRADCVS